MRTENKKPNNPRMQEFDGMYANDAYKLINDPFTLRDYFANSAMQGMLSNTNIIDDVSNSVPEWIAIRSYLIADAMLKQREL